MRTVAAGVALLLATVAGCSSDEPAPVEVEPLASASGSPGPSSSSASTPSAEPTKKAGPTAASLSAGVEPPSAFVERYLEELSRSFQALDASGLRQLSDAGCGGCRNFISAVERAEVAGERTVGGDFRLLTAAAPPPEGGETIVEIRYSRDPALVVDRAGDEVVRLPADAPINAQMRLLATGRSWLVLGFRAT